MHFTATPGIPHPPPNLKTTSSRGGTEVEPLHFTARLMDRLRALYAQSIRATLAPYVLPRLLARS
jgi:hypothetical protein